MDRDGRNAAIAAAVILVAFGAFAYWLPTLMLAAGNVSTALAAVIGIVFVLALFVVLWLRGRAQRKE
jgi:apolipoprotein N-acyltransferase